MKEIDKRNNDISVTDETKNRFKYAMALLTRQIHLESRKNESFRHFVLESIRRFRNFDFGELSEEDKNQNNQALTNFGRILAEYKYHESSKIWIIMEENESSLLVMFPSEY